MINQSLHSPQDGSHVTTFVGFDGGLNCWATTVFGSVPEAHMHISNILQLHDDPADSHRAEKPNRVKWHDVVQPKLLPHRDLQQNRGYVYADAHQHHALEGEVFPLHEVDVVAKSPEKDVCADHHPYFVIH